MHEDVAAVGKRLPRQIHRPSTVPNHGHQLLLQIDGGGRSLIVTADVARIGPAGRGIPFDVPLASGFGLHPFLLERIEEDYFLKSDEPIRVNQESTALAITE